jgi:N4-gp56 family major capsid protein
MGDIAVYATLADVDKAKYDAKIRIKAATKVVHSQFFEQGDISEESHVAYFTVWSKLDSTPTTRLLSTTADPDPETLADTQVGITAYEYGNLVASMQALRKTAILNVVAAKEQLISINLAETIDRVIAYRLFSALAAPSGWKANAGALGADMILKVGTTLMNQSAPPRAGDLYSAIISPFTYRDIFADTDQLKGFVSVAKYADPAAAYNFEIGAFMGFRWVWSPFAYNATVDSVRHDYPLFFGANVFGQANGYDPEITVWQGRDALKRKLEIGWKAERGYGVIDTNNVIELDIQPTVW